MTSAPRRHLAASPPRRRLRRLAVPAALATAVTAGVVGVSVATTGSRPPVVAAVAVPSPSPSVTGVPDRVPHLADRSVAVSRSAKRVTLKKKPEIKDREFMTASLNLWPAPREKGKPLAVLKEGGKVAITGVQRAAFAQILHDGQVRWVKKAYLVDKLPKPEADAPATDSAAGSTATGLSTAPCPDGSGTESGLTSSAVRLFRSVCNAFPALSSYGGYDGHGEHSTGKAIDFMTSDSSLGQAVADWARAHASELDLYDVIWAQHIWTPVRAGEGWRSMPDRGSSTANHYDHVHISVN